ncbi:helix-turn-helix transcriptional regulator [Alcanivorax sp. 1008]|uniref:ArsR/SmtB family transcription factor n=1 Tax=Alcanivorax sp. 1008 TaxID=2816853 RepID=UPI001DEA8988|nr:helix-turn-helix domain-containing protein [Alcanivorax sp. 1008]MCC1496092.1 helix-turn-helix transcriptional regulator [Alcanivorax sp. 1008]
MDRDCNKISKIFKALSSQHRLQIYLKILERQRAELTELTDSSSTAKKEGNCQGCSLADFINQFSISAPTISHHIKELVNADLIRVERNGKYVTCFLNDETRATVEQLFKSA